MDRANEKAPLIDKQGLIRRISQFIQEQTGDSPIPCISNVPQELLAQFEVSEVVIPPGRAGGRHLVVQGSGNFKYLEYEDRSTPQSGGATSRVSARTRHRAQGVFSRNPRHLLG
jgi:hypothetical protein